jgi:hypothetical protein
MIVMDKYEQAKNRIAMIDAQIFELSHERSQIQQWLDDGDRLFGGIVAPQLAAGYVPQSGQQEGGKRANSFKAVVIRTAESILRTQPSLPTKDLVIMLEMHGVEISGENKVLTVAQVMTRQKDKFVSGKNGWELKK